MDVNVKHNPTSAQKLVSFTVKMTRMKMADCNLKKLATILKFLLSILEKLKKNDYSFFFLGETVSYFPPSAR